MSSHIDIDTCTLKMWCAVVALTAREVRDRKRPDPEAVEWLRGFGADVLWLLGCNDLADLATRGAAGDRAALEELLDTVSITLRSHTSKPPKPTPPERRPRTREDRARSMREAWERRRAAAASVDDAEEAA